MAQAKKKDEGRYELLLDLPGAANVRHKIPGFPVELHPTEPTPIEETGLTVREVQAWIDQHTPKPHTEILGLGTVTAGLASRDTQPVVDGRCPVKLTDRSEKTTTTTSTPEED